MLCSVFNQSRPNLGRGVVFLSPHSPRCLGFMVKVQDLDLNKRELNPRAPGGGSQAGVFRGKRIWGGNLAKVQALAFHLQVILHIPETLQKSLDFHKCCAFKGLLQCLVSHEHWILLIGIYPTSTPVGLDLQHPNLQEQTAVRSKKGHHSCVPPDSVSHPTLASVRNVEFFFLIETWLFTRKIKVNTRCEKQWLQEKTEMLRWKKLVSV